MNIWNPFARSSKRHRQEVDDAAEPATVLELAAALRAVEPAARLVLPRVLRRVIRIHADLHGFAFRVPHGKSYVIAREALLEIADRSDLGMTAEEALPERVLLLEQPSSDELATWSRDAAFLRIWRLLFHAKVHEVLHARESAKAFNAARITAHIAQLGPLIFTEIRSVLEQELFMLPPYDDARAYEEFVAVFLGMRKFNPCLLPSFFPSIARPEAVDAMIAEFIDADALLQATRLPNTPEPNELADMTAALLDPLESGGMTALAEGRETASARRLRRTGGKGSRQRNEKTYLRWSARADRQTARGNLAGAAIRRARAEFAVPRERAAEAAAALRDDVYALVERLQTALGEQDEDPRPWREALLALAHQTPLGIWTPEARTIYDLQKVCIDHEKAISTVDVMHWVLSWGRRPICRQLPNQREVLMSAHLRRALARLPVVRISERQRRQLGAVLTSACEKAELRLREQFRPHIEHALNHIQLMPTNLPERVAREKLVDELLDGIVERGFLTLGGVRDALSRNNLKQPDCAGVRDFLGGNAVLRANRVLAVTLDGVYERGDFYLRWIQRFSLLAFGTPAGRFLTKYFAMPFGGAAIVLKALEHFASMLSGRELVWAPEPAGRVRSIADWEKVVNLASWQPKMPTLCLGLFLFGLFHIPMFRRFVWETLKTSYRAARFALFDAPRWLLRQPPIQAILQSRVVRFLFRVVVKPLVPTLIVWRFLPGHSAVTNSVWGPVLVFLTLNLALNSRIGRNFEEVIFDWTAETVSRFGVRFIVGVFWFIVDLFRTLLQGVERIMYSVDEWLRFRSGQNRAMLVVKGALGILWFFVSYVMRFTISLLVEPQINPLKHVPVVTVSHKCIAPFFKELKNALTARGFSPFSAWATTFVTISGTPGIFGFIAWEFKENWRLFSANRPKNLGPVMIGHHGETLARLFKPGFHSGTVPKRFAKLRRAERKALESGDAHAARSQRDALDHLEESLRHWGQREFVQWFREIAAWRLPPPELGEIHLATNHTRMYFRFGDKAEVELVVTFQLTDGRLEAELAGTLAALELPTEAQRVFQLAMTSMLKTGGVEAIVLPDEASAHADFAQLESFCLEPAPWHQWIEQWNAAEAATDSESPVAERPQGI